MELDKLSSGTANIHVIGVFNERVVNEYENPDVDGLVRAIMDDKDILYENVIKLTGFDGKLTVQVKMSKSAINESSVDEVRSIFKAVNGFETLWISTDSAMSHPEIIRGEPGV